MVSEPRGPRTFPQAYPVARRPVALATWFAPMVLAPLVLVTVYTVDPRTPGNYPLCLFLFLTGCYCPGCGTLRALHALIHGDPRSALGYNLLSVVTLPSLGAAYTYGLVREIGLPRLPRMSFSPHLAWATLVIILAFWALRNVPLYPLTMLAP